MRGAGLFPVRAHSDLYAPARTSSSQMASRPRNRGGVRHPRARFQHQARHTADWNVGAHPGLVHHDNCAVEYVEMAVLEVSREVFIG